MKPDADKRLIDSHHGQMNCLKERSMRARHDRVLCLVILASHFWISIVSAAEPKASPLSPEEERSSFRLADDNLIIELVASEPDVVSPVAVAWDEEGRMFVAEMRDYPSGSAGGCVKVLDQPDENGRYRRATVYADTLPFPNSVLPWKGGVFVTAAPNIWFIKRPSRHDKSEERRIVLTGFNEGNPQLRVNGLTWGLNNWIYGANGRSDGLVRRPEQPASKAVHLRRHDFRFQSATGAFETTTGFSQFGLCFDDWGNRFLSWNTRPFRHVVFEDRLLERNPNLPAASTVESIIDAVDPGRLFPISARPTTFNREPVDFFNASCGNTVYRGDLLGPPYAGNAFVCEPLTNLVHRRALRPSGVSFVAERSEPAREFLAATDSWFHPVNLATGPDGALYVVDFYRQWVEHPQFVSKEMRGKIDWRQGADHGRIWRIRAKGKKSDLNPRLSGASTASLVADLASANGWRRETAQRLIVERQDKGAKTQLESRVQKSSSAVERIHALWTLEGLGVLNDATVRQALASSHPRVRENALRLSENGWRMSTELQSALARLVKDSDARVRLQAILAIGDMDRAAKLPLLAEAVERDCNDEWFRLAIQSGLKEQAWEFARQLLTRPRWQQQLSAGQRNLLKSLAALSVVETQQEFPEALTWVTGAQSENALDSSLCILCGVGEGMARTGKSLSKTCATQDDKAVADALNRCFRQYFATAKSARQPAEIRALAIKVLLDARPDMVAVEDVKQWLQPAQPVAVQLAAARSLANVDRKLIRAAVGDWGVLTTRIRSAVIDALVQSPISAAALVDALAAGDLSVNELDPAARDILRQFPDQAVRKRAAPLFQQLQDPNRPAVLAKYAAAISKPGDSGRGALVFMKNCLTCHRLHDQGHRVGPDLAAIGSRVPQALLVDVLDPNRDVPPDFISYVLITRRGQVVTGLLAEETATAVKLRRAEGIEQTWLRSEIQELRATGKSLMPEGLERTITEGDMADLLVFLRKPVPFPQASDAR